MLLTPQNITSKLQFGFTHVFCWPLSVSRSISLSAVEPQSLESEFHRKESQYQNHIANLEAMYQMQRERTEKLSGVVERLPLEGANFVLSDVIDVSVDGGHAELSINRGENDGICKGQFVLSDNSVVGVISNTTARIASVKLFTDPSSKLEVSISGISRMMKGIDGNLAKVSYMSPKHNIKVGDGVFARKPGFLDSPIIAGKVTKFKRDDQNPSSWEITVKPVCDFASLKNVVVIIMNPKEH